MIPRQNVRVLPSSRYAAHVEAYLAEQIQYPTLIEEAYRFSDITAWVVLGLLCACILLLAWW